MIPKQDRQGVRHARDIEQKYDLNTDFSEIEKIATDARRIASDANSKAREASAAVAELTESTESQFTSINEGMANHGESISNLDERVGTLEQSGGGGGGSGTPGEDGATFTPSVDSEGNLSWTNDKGLENPATVNIKGEKGETGAAGANGADATINGVNTLTIEAGDNIELEQTGNVLTINSKGGGGGGSYEVLTIEEIMLICGWQANGLPAGYTLLEYIESSGTQHIDTGFIPNQDTRVVCRALLPVSSKTHWLFGCRYSTSDRKFAFAASSSGKYSAHYNSGNPTFPSTFKPTGVITVDFDKQNISVIADSETQTVTGTYGAFDGSNSMLLFACDTNGSIAYGSSAIYACQIYDNGNLVRDFVPCINPDGAYGLFDKVSKQFYGNAGSGAFTGS